MSMFLNKRCKYCKELLHKSKHISPVEREKRDAAKEFCGGVCAAKYKATQPEVKSLVKHFLYGGVK